MHNEQPSFISAFHSGLLDRMIDQAQERLAACDLCARRCGADRLHGEEGYCKAPASLVVSSAAPHFGEEAPLVGRGGSGTIFFTHCPLGCVFCQNYDISHFGQGKQISRDELARQMIYLQNLGCHNINFVTPTHFLPQIMAALPRAVEYGLSVPLVWNCGGYEAVESLALLEGVVDIYMPDFKFAESAPALKYCNAPDYPEVAKAALKEMQRQVGSLKMDRWGIAERGLLIRHLVMPGEAGNTRKVLDYIAGEISRDSYVNIMDQYCPACRAGEYPDINRRITSREYGHAVEYARKLGLSRGFE